MFPREPELFGQVSADDLTCNICQSIFVEPVLLPCGHGFCLSCFNGVLRFNALTCPCCRKRFGTWLRKANKGQTLVDQALWRFIQTNFAEELGKENLQPRSGDRADCSAPEGETQSRCIDAPGAPADATTSSSPTGTAATAAARTAGFRSIKPQLSQPGEIRKEYETQLDVFRKELEIERQNELKATSAYIAKIIAEELNTLQPTPNPGNLPETSSETMLVANPGHSSYALSSTKKSNNLSSIQAESKKNVIGAASSTSISNSGASSFHQNNGEVASTQSAAPSTATFLAQSTKSNLIKTLAVRLNRGTDILKQSVHKAIIAKIPQNFLTRPRNREVLTVPPTNTHRFPSRDANSADSLRLEMCHFKPIRTVPTTPNKQNNKEILLTPKAKRALESRFDDCERRSTDVKPSLLQQLLLQSPRKSAFCVVGAATTLQSSSGICLLRSSRFSNRQNRNFHVISESLKSEIIRRNPVVLLKRVELSISKAKKSQRTKSKQSKLERNSDVGSSRRSDVFRKSKTQYRYRNHRIDNSNVVNLEALEKLISEQKRCEELIEQERRDFELAKKLQAELDVHSQRSPDRTNSQKRKRESMNGKLKSECPNQNGSTEAGPSASAKRCRRTCGRTVTFREVDGTGKTQHKKSSAVDVDKTCTTSNLRRSTRRIKPTRRYFQ